MDIERDVKKKSILNNINKIKKINYFHCNILNFSFFIHKMEIVHMTYIDVFNSIYMYQRGTTL